MERGRVAERFREVEIEGRGVGRRALERIAGVLTGNGAAPAEQTPKLVRALGERAEAPPDIAEAETPRPRDPAAHAVRAAIAAGVRRMILNDPRTRLGEVEPLHQMRVGTRRLRSDLRTFRPLLDKDWAESLRAELKWLGSSLGAVRDLDVLLERLRREGDDLSPRLHAAARGTREPPRRSACRAARGPAQRALRGPARPAGRGRARPAVVRPRAAAKQGGAAGAGGGAPGGSSQGRPGARRRQP